MKERKNDSSTLYVIPENFIEGGRIFNGMFKLRNFVEAVLIAAVFALVALSLPITNLTARISVVITMVLPPFFIGVTGINDEPLSIFLRSVMRWRKNHAKMVYNNQTGVYTKSPLEVMMSEDIARDKLVSAVENWQSKRKQSVEAQRSACKYEFEEDSELSRLIDKPDTGAKKTKSSGKKATKKKTPQKAPEAPSVESVFAEGNIPPLSPEAVQAPAAPAPEPIMTTPAPAPASPEPTFALNFDDDDFDDDDFEIDLSALL